MIFCHLSQPSWNSLNITEGQISHTLPSSSLPTPHTLRLGLRLIYVQILMTINRGTFPLQIVYVKPEMRSRDRNSSFELRYNFEWLQAELYPQGCGYFNQIHLEGNEVVQNIVFPLFGIMQLHLDMANVIPNANILIPSLPLALFYLRFLCIMNQLFSFPI